MHARPPTPRRLALRLAPHASCRHPQTPFYAYSLERCVSCRAEGETAAAEEQASTSDSSSATPSAAGAVAGTAGRMTYKPESYSVLVTDAANAVAQGADAGFTCMEVEFPAISGLDCAPPPPRPLFV